MPIRTGSRRDEVGGPDRWGVSTQLAERMQELSVRPKPLFVNQKVLYIFSNLAWVRLYRKIGRRSFSATGQLIIVPNSTPSWRLCQT